MSKIIAALVAGLFSVGVFAQAAPAKKEEAKPAAAAPAKKDEKKADAKPAAAAPAAKPADKK
jgi:hypothetical protein